jgi:hypothetical protein
MWMANATYTGSNNPQNLPAYALVSAGVSTALAHGELTLAASNIFNAYGGIFATPQNAVPYMTPSGLSVPTIARPNAPREFAVTYTARFGQGAQPVTPSLPGQEGGPGERGRGGFARFMQPLPQTPPIDPFAVNSSPMCTADAQKTAQAVLAGLKAYTQQIEAAKTPAGYPQNMPSPDIPGIAVTYHGLTSTYALSIAVKQGAQLRSLFGCTQFHVTDRQTAQQRNLYVEPSTGGMFFRPIVTFMPAVGLYFVRRPPQPGAESFRMYKLPPTPPKAPFALRFSQTCTGDMHNAAQQMLAQLQSHFTTGAAAPGWTIAAHAATAGTWYSLEAADIGTVPAMLNCAHVSAAAKADLTKLGWDGAAPPTLNYTPALGLYIVIPQRRRAPGENGAQ